MTTVAQLVSNNTKDELLQMCSQKNIVCRKSWSKKKLAEALVKTTDSARRTSPQPSNTSSPTVSQLVSNNTKDELLQMCSQKNIVCRKSWSKKKLAEAIKGIQQPAPSNSPLNFDNLKQNISKCSTLRPYKKSDVQRLARELNVDDKGTRAEICERIQRALEMFGPEPSSPDEEFKDDDTPEYKCNLSEIAAMLGINSRGSDRELCNRIKQAISTEPSPPPLPPSPSPPSPPSPPPQPPSPSPQPPSPSPQPPPRRRQTPSPANSGGAGNLRTPSPVNSGGAGNIRSPDRIIETENRQRINSLLSNISVADTATDMAEIQTEILNCMGLIG